MRRLPLVTVFIIALLLPAATVRAAAYLPFSIRVATAGVVIITDRQLLDAGWPAPIPRDRITVSNRDGAVAVADTGSGIAFIGLPGERPWTRQAVYWLRVQGNPASRTVLPSRLPTPIRWEPDTFYDRHQMTGRGDGWWAGELRGSNAITATLTLPDDVPAGTSLQLSLKATQARRGHLVNVFIDGQPPTTVGWDDPTSGAQIVTQTITLSARPSGLLTLTLTQAVSGDTVLLDALTLPTVFASAMPLPALSLLPVVNLPDGLAGADLLMVVPAALRASLDPLVTAHTRLGRRVVVADIQAAYDAYSGGERDPEAIRELVRAARPRAVLLVGAGTVALRQETPARPTLIPPYPVWLSGDGETACDTCYGRLNEGSPTTQTLPDIPVGRFPVATPAEAQVVVEKTVAVLLGPVQGAWRNRVVVLADNDRQPDGTPDPAGAFTTVAEQGLAALPAGLNATRLYYAPDRTVANGPFEPDPARLRCRLFRTLDGGRATDRDCAPVDTASAGAALWVYIGHGSPWQWANTTPTAPTPYLWYLYDADRLRNGGRLPILLSMTCLSGDFSNPVLQSNDERLVLRNGGGVIASLSSSGEGVNTGHARLLLGVAGTLYAPTGDRSIGASHLAGLRALEAGTPGLAFAFALLGDPFVGVPFVPTTRVMLPVVKQ